MLIHYYPNASRNATQKLYFHSPHADAVKVRPVVKIGVDSDEHPYNNLLMLQNSNIADDMEGGEMGVLHVRVPMTLLTALKVEAAQSRTRIQAIVELALKTQLTKRKGKV